MQVENLVDFETAPFDIIDGDRGKNYPKQNEFLTNGYCLFLSATNVTRDGFKFSQCQYISEQKDNILRKGKLHRNDVVLTTRGTIGNSAFFNYKILFDHLRINSGMVILRCNKEKILPAYLYHFLRSTKFQGQVNALKSGVAQPQLPIRDMKRIKIPLPDIIIQQKIADILSTYDDLIENNRRRIELLEKSAQLLYKEWFVHLRFPGHEHVKVVDGVPDGWERKMIGDISETIGGGTPSTKTPEYWDDGHITWFTPKDLTANKCLVLLYSNKRITEMGLKKSSAKMLPPETILMSSRASIGFFGLYEYECCTNQGFISCVPKIDSLRMYLLYNLMSRIGEIIGLASGTTFKEISKTNFRTMPIIIPSVLVLEEFEQYIYDIIKKVRVLKKQMYKLTKARDLLLPRLMNGEIEV